MLELFNLFVPKGARKKKKRVGRGEGSGTGKTSGRGHKGQKARSGGGPRPGFEGGQMPLQRRLPKKGFHNIFKKKWSLVNLGSLKKISEGVITPVLLKEAGLIKHLKYPVKLLGEGTVSRPITVLIHYASRQALAKVEEAGGKVVILSFVKKEKNLPEPAPESVIELGPEAETVSGEKTDQNSAEPEPAPESEKEIVPE